MITSRDISNLVPKTSSASGDVRTSGRALSSTEKKVVETLPLGVKVIVLQIEQIKQLKTMKKVKKLQINRKCCYVVGKNGRGRAFGLYFF